MPEPSSTPDPGAASKQARRSRARVRYHASMKVVRRIHLYSGLFLVPWVFLYGVTAFLFNHPDAFPDREGRAVPRAPSGGPAIEGMPNAEELADRVARALDARAGGGHYRRPAGGPGATLSRALTITATGPGREHSVRYDLDAGSAIVRSTASRAEATRAVPGGDLLRLDDPPRDRLTRGSLALLDRLGIRADSALIRNPPDLIFDLDADDGRWRASYNLQTERISLRKADDAADLLSGRRFLTGLHLSFGYPAAIGPRWGWAPIVDAMAASMVTWGASGLIMWWQMKSLRRLGALALVASLALAALLGSGMHALLAR